jgi:hypothetical protein
MVRRAGSGCELTCAFGKMSDKGMGLGVAGRKNGIRVGTDNSLVRYRCDIG